MADIRIDIPDRDVFKAAEVCEIAAVQPYVLRSWEKEFPTLGMARTAGGPRVYRRADVELVLRIKQFVYGEGLTLAGVRRKLDEEKVDAVAADMPAVVTPDARKKIAGIKDDLKALLALLDHPTAERASAVAAAATAPVPWPPKGEQPTLLDLSAIQNDNGRADSGVPDVRSAGRAGKRSRRTP